MLKMRISEYVERNYAQGSRPSLMTVKRRIKRGELPGVKEGGRWYVLVNEDGTPQQRSGLQPVNALVDRVMSRIES